MKFDASSYTCSKWHSPAKGAGLEIRNAVSGSTLCNIDSAGINFAAAACYAREVGAPVLRSMSIHERALMIKELATSLLRKKEDFYAISTATGATRADSWIDIEGGIATLFGISSIARRELHDQPFTLEGEPQKLSARGTFMGQHILVRRHGLSLHINAFNFPCWGMLEKIAPSLIAGVPAIVKPASPSAYLAAAMVREIIASRLLPKGSLQLICGRIGNLLEHMTAQDTVTFTGSAATGKHLRTHPDIIDKAVPFNMETDSLNCAILGRDAIPGTPEFDLYIAEVVREITVKCGQKCTAIRRAIVPANHANSICDALCDRLRTITVGDPANEEVRMGSLIGLEQRQQVREHVAALRRESTRILGAEDDFAILGDTEKGAFFPPTVLFCKEPLHATAVHDIEAFGPVCTIMPYRDTTEAIALAARGRGSLVGSIFTADDDEAQTISLGCTHWHGRLMLINRDSATESTGHGSPLPALVHGGPGRAGNGEELGGVRAIARYMQRTALQGSPTTLTAITRQYMRGAQRLSGARHPFRMCFEELQIGYSIRTHRRTITEADIVQFGCISGDHFYAHFDETAASDSLFGKRVAHGYFLIAAAAGMFVDPGPGPVLANYGLDKLRFITPVGIGDTIEVCLTAKRKTTKLQRNTTEPKHGIVTWDAEITNQCGDIVAQYEILTLVAYKGSEVPVRPVVNGEPQLTAAGAQTRA